jgi:hypothetical protein
MTDVSMILLIGIVGGLVLWLIESLARKVHPLGLLVVLGLVLGLYFAVGDGDGSESVSCPGYEIAVGLYGKCYGMDADANVEWLEKKMGVQP